MRGKLSFASLHRDLPEAKGAAAVWVSWRGFPLLRVRPLASSLFCFFRCFYPSSGGGASERASCHVINDHHAGRCCFCSFHWGLWPSLQVRFRLRNPPLPNRFNF